MIIENFVKYNGKELRIVVFFITMNFQQFDISDLKMFHPLLLSSSVVLQMCSSNEF